eukprot:1708484-Amphidinium_carterae.1
MALGDEYGMTLTQLQSPIQLSFGALPRFEWDCAAWETGVGGWKGDVEEVGIESPTSLVCAVHSTTMERITF